MKEKPVKMRYREPILFDARSLFYFITACLFWLYQDGDAQGDPVRVQPAAGVERARDAVAARIRQGGLAGR